MRNRPSMLEILLLAPKNTFELLLSSEIGTFEVEMVDLYDFPLKSLLLGQREMLGLYSKIIKNPPPQLQMCLARGSRGVRKCS